MANTHVVLRDEMGLRVPSIPEVSIVAADTVTFTTEHGANSALFFTPETASILSPHPESPVHLAFGHALTYEFLTPAPGVYGVITEASPGPVPESYFFGDPANPPVLVIHPGSGATFGGPSNDTQT